MQMKRRWLITGTLSAGLVLTGATGALAGEWKQDAQGWWWQNDDGTYPVNQWLWLDGNQDQIAECYYFNESGYLLTNTITPDHYVVNANGEWVLDGMLQIQVAGIPVNTVSTVSNSAAVTGIMEDGASGVIAHPGTVSGVPVDRASGAAEDTAGAAAEAVVDSAENTITGELEIDRTIGKNFIKQIFIECIGRERSQVEELLGVSGEVEETEDYAEGMFDFHITYVLSQKEDVRIDYKNDIAVRIFGTNTELLNFEKDEYTLSEIDAILGITHTTWEGAHFWRLQKEPEVTIELVNDYASLNAY